jgi:hypothetical protein
MDCPRCKNAGFQPTSDVPSPLKVVGTESFPHFTSRRIICLQCGYYFKSKELFDSEIQVKGVKIMEMVADAQAKIKAAKPVTKKTKMILNLFNQ